MLEEQDALRFYYEKFPLLVDYPVVVGKHYYLMIKRDGNILFHANSVIGFCHVFNPEQFKELTSNTMRKAFPKHQVVFGKGLCLSFRQVTEAEFREIVEG